MEVYAGFAAHTDYEAGRLISSIEKLGIIDNQDAIMGNPLYDVASLIDDVRIKLPSDLQNKLFKFYCKKKIQRNPFYYWKRTSFYFRQ